MVGITRYIKKTLDIDIHYPFRQKKRKHVYPHTHCHQDDAKQVVVERLKESRTGQRNVKDYEEGNQVHYSGFHPDSACQEVFHHPAFHR